jgi:AraC-like DNA-binding protein
MIGTYLVRFSTDGNDPGDMVSGCVCAGNPRHHVHAEWQLAVPDTAAGLSLGAFRRFAVPGGELTIVPPYTVHSEASVPEAPTRWHVLYVTSRSIAKLGREDGGRSVPSRNCEIPVVHERGQAEELRQLLDRWSDGTIEEPEVLRRIRAWLVSVIQRHGLAAMAPASRSGVERARAYLQDRPTEVVRLADLAREARASVGHLTRSFSRLIGLSPQRYHAAVRLAHARELLSAGELASRVAHECGFADQSHLNRRFKERYGVTPGAFQSIASQGQAGDVEVAL